MESWFLVGKTPNSGKMVLINFFLAIASREKNAFFSKSHKNTVIKVFWHAEFISALKTDLNPTVFEKNAKNKIKYLTTIIFYFLLFKLLAELHKNKGIVVFR